MGYVKTVWVDVQPGTDPGAAPQLDADNLTHLEQGIVDEETARIRGPATP